MEIFLSILVIVIAYQFIKMKKKSLDKKSRILEVQNKLDRIDDTHLDILIGKLEKLISYDDYGNKDYKKFFEELDYYIISTIKINKVNEDFTSIKKKLLDKIIEYQDKQPLKINNVELIDKTVIYQQLEKEKVVVKKEQKKGKSIFLYILYVLIAFIIFIYIVGVNSNNASSYYDCDSLWEKHNECVTNSLLGLPCRDGTDISIPEECRK